ncbi:hypothetical protein HDV57DRAFT_152821 [Trichoderma longibrachiatum]|uniref:Uncharacterized protein n=1 Tax=Trichoderma longibrachiatum ATCC 18648 TaxID=983965 RepID=A0A2T4CAZ7_TRILO|nr:hypothetical protein M440DRAFT_268538 [Trichoderma longibrachiatum ATCC 18648]
MALTALQLYGASCSSPCQLNRAPAACCLPPSSRLHSTLPLIGQLRRWSLLLMHLTPVCIKANISAWQPSSINGCGITCRTLSSLSREQLLISFLRLFLVPLSKSQCKCYTGPIQKVFFCNSWYILRRSSPRIFISKILLKRSKSEHQESKKAKTKGSWVSVYLKY